MSLVRRAFDRFVQISAVSFGGIALLSADSTFNDYKVQKSIGSLFRKTPSPTGTATAEGLRKEDKSKRPKVGLGCLILRKNEESLEFLVGVRKSSHGEGLYALPGGHLEYGESWAACARNETMEECNLDIPDKDWWFAFVNNSISPGNEPGDEELHYIDIIMSAVYDGKEEPINAEPHKCEGWKWVKWNDHQLERERTFCGLRAILSVDDFDPLRNVESAVAFDQWQETHSE